ncbi:MAG: S-methyl-5-thioribose kinase, partial [Komagataeibacter saccharivorans]
IGFAAVAIIRRLIGYAHTADFDAIADPQQRGACRAGALAFAYHVLEHHAEVVTIGDFLLNLGERGKTGL